MPWEARTLNLLQGSQQKHHEENVRRGRIVAFPQRRRAGEIPEGVSARGVLRRDALYRRALATADVFSAAFALLFAMQIAGQDRVKPTVLLAIPFVILISKAIGLYDRDELLVRKTTLDELPALFHVATLYTLVVWLSAGLFVEPGPLGQDQVLGLWAALFASMAAVRAASRVAVRAGTSPERCLVIGDADAASRVRRKLEESYSVKAVMVGRVPLDPEERGRDEATLGGLDALGLVLVEHDIERAIIAPSGPADSDEILHAIRLVKSLGVKVSVVPRLFEVVGTSVEFDDVDGVMLLGVRRYGLSQSSRYLKRGTDLVGVSIGLLALAPLLVWISLAIKLTSPGPVLFRQRRVGLNGRSFEMLKFRTMCHDAESRKSELRARNEAAEGLFKIADDPRITRIGRLLRRASLDELPQLFNVLRGEMSLVGPRPLVPDEDERVEGLDRRRLHVQPGMTGLWQIFGSSRIPLHEMVKIDYLYGANWSLWLDVKILLRTIPYALSGRGL